jgi:hypothetical protein
VNLLRLRRSFCRQLATLPNSEAIQRKAAADMIAVIDEALQAQKAAEGA